VLPETAHTTGDFQYDLGLFFLVTCFCLSMIPGLFVETGLVFGLSGLFRPPRIPLGISVENRVLEIVGLESESGLITGDS
jgi:hypothetical protein